MTLVSVKVEPHGKANLVSLKQVKYWQFPGNANVQNLHL